MEKLIPLEFGEKLKESTKASSISLDQLADLCEEVLDFDKRQTIEEKLMVKRKPFVLV